MTTTTLDRPQTLDAPPPPRRNDRPSDPPEPIPDAATLRYACRALSYELHSERDDEYWARIFAIEGADIRSAAVVVGALRSNSGVPSLFWLFAFVAAELEASRVDDDLGSILAVVKAYAAAPDAHERHALGFAVGTLIEQLNVRDAMPSRSSLYELTLCVWGVAFALRTYGPQSPVLEAELRGVVRCLAELHARRSEHPVAVEATAVADRMIAAFRGQR